MKLQVLGIGKIREPFYKDGVDEYAGRIRHYLPIRVIEAAKERSGNPRDLEEAYSKLRKDHMKASARVALDRTGRAMSSEKLAGWLENAMVTGQDLASFIIGGPHGLASGAVEDSGLVLSLSALTLPHQMARLLLMEQLYRAMTIIRGEPYHK
ncbi:MAG: 23S rRNA (pseudouridine(1915)-N(3))-methyltransferase RlmH [bacterium]|nr:23S rRNA (pseudouridine(1915)-N(3))-methyltransferase RlmH [bacterium]MDT8395566.1 23S rRNA (pseudouridine(1915)-N(3))-methyltransferase RlmH [bacterium]